MRVLTFLFVLIAPVLSFGADLEGRVIAIADGDSFTLLTVDKQQLKIRLAQVDAPEKAQPYGNRSREALSGLIFGKDIRIEVETKDRYGRTVGTAYVGDRDVNREMVRLGAAWVYRQYVRDEGLFTVEKDARDNAQGLWGTSEAKHTPPWEWRREGNQEGAPANCNIKGNINSEGEKIYHLPGVSGYGQTRIDTSNGERWFCSEEEAVSMGWRAKH